MMLDAHVNKLLFFSHSSVFCWSNLRGPSRRNRRVQEDFFPRLQFSEGTPQGYEGQLGRRTGLKAVRAVRVLAVCSRLRAGPSHSSSLRGTGIRCSCPRIPGLCAVTLFLGLLGLTAQTCDEIIAPLKTDPIYIWQPCYSSNKKATKVPAILISCWSEVEGVVACPSPGRGYCVWPRTLHPPTVNRTVWRRR